MAIFHPKVTTAALAGALTTIIISELGKHGYPIDGSEGAAIAVVLSFFAGWFTPSGGADQPAAPAPAAQEPPHAAPGQAP